MYSVCKNNGYICGVVSGSSTLGNAITEEEYSHIKSIIFDKPAAPDGYGYRLRENLEWELYAVPIPETPEEADEGDYSAALGELGVAL